MRGDFGVDSTPRGLHHSEKAAAEFGKGNLGIEQTTCNLCFFISGMFLRLIIFWLLYFNDGAPEACINLLGFG